MAPSGRRPRIRLDQAKKVVLAVPSHPNFGVEIDHGRIHRVRHGVKELNRRRLLKTVVALHAPADVEQETEVQRHRLGIASQATSEVANLLGPTVLEHLEVSDREIGDRSPVLIEHRHADVDDVDSAGKDRRLCRYKGRQPAENSDERDVPEPRHQPTIRPIITRDFHFGRPDQSPYTQDR